MSEYQKVIQDIDGLQRNLYENLFDLLGFTADTPPLHAKLIKEKQQLVDYIKTSTDIGEEMKEKLADMINAETVRIGKYPAIIYPVSLVYAVAHFESFLMDIIKFLIRTFPACLITSKKLLTYEEALKYSKLEDLVDSLIEKELIEISFKNIKNQIEYLGDKFNIKYKNVPGERTWGEDEMDINAVSELFAMRNIILHNNGIVNRKFINDCPNTTYSFGERILVKDEKVSDGLLLLLAVSHKISRKAKVKIEGVRL